GTPVDEDEVARARVHRQPRLRRKLAVVARDQIVHFVEVPALRGGPPRACKTLGAGAVLRTELVPCLRQLLLVQADCDLDRAQPPHPGERAAERRQLRVRVRPEVPESLPQRRTGERVPAEILRQRLTLAPVPG